MRYSSIVEYIWRGRIYVGLRGWNAIAIKQGLKAQVSEALSANRREKATYLLFLPLTCSFHTITRLNDIGFETDGSGGAMELEEEAAGIAQDGAHLITTPKRRC